MNDKLYFGTCDECGYFGEIYAVEKEVDGSYGRLYLCSTCENEFNSKRRKDDD